MRICASILNWNAWEQTVACVRSLQALCEPTLHIAVVDNASQEPLTPALQDVHLMCAAENRGYSGGHRLALHWAQQCGAELLWLLNNDLLVRPETLAQLLRAYRQHGAALYGSLPLDFDGAQVNAGVKFYLLDGRGKPDMRRSWEGEAIPRTGDHSLANLSGSSLLIPLSVIAQHGFMDDRFFLYWEETDYCFRLARRGVRSILVADSQVWHRSGGAVQAQNTTLRHVIRYYINRNRLVVLRRYARPRHYFYVLRTELRQAAKVLRQRPLGMAERFYLHSVRDGLLGRLGKTYAPEAYR
jgi:GT2 family glycosyltransferase